MSVSSPAATGGAGGQFEDHFGAFALGLLLARGAAPVLKDHVVSEVHFQTEHLGWKADDVLIVGESAGSQRRLACQVKRQFSVAKSSDDFRDTFLGFWDDFTAGQPYQEAHDQFGIVTVQGTTALLHHFRSLLDCARASPSCEDFSRRLELDGHVSAQAKKQYGVVVDIFREAHAEAVTDELIWRLLRVVHVLSYDLGSDSAQSAALLQSLLAQACTASADPSADARRSWGALLELAGEWSKIAKSVRRDDLPLALRERHLAVAIGSSELGQLVGHGKAVTDTIRSTIGETLELERAAVSSRVAGALSRSQAVLVTGPPGSGKSAVAKRVLSLLGADHQVFAFNSVEFATSHIDESFSNAQSALTASRFFSLLAGCDRKVILVESVERLLERPIRDGLSQLLAAARKDSSVRLIFTCRDYSSETVRSSLLRSSGLASEVVAVPELNDEELEEVATALPELKKPLGAESLRALLRNPYLLDSASRLDWDKGPLPETQDAFRKKCWAELIRADGNPAGAMPVRRERVFVDLARRRATELRPYVRASDDDLEVLSRLQADGLVAVHRERAGWFAPAHDVLEDWAVLQWLDELRADASDAAQELATAVGAYPALRRGYRRWLNEWFERDSAASTSFVVEMLPRKDIPPYSRDDSLVAALLSSSARAFILDARDHLVADECRLLCRVVHMLRVACQEAPAWLPASGLPSLMLVPAGDGWAPALELVAEQMETLVSRDSRLVLGLVEDWAKAVTWDSGEPDGAAAVGSVLQAMLPHCDGYRRDDFRKRVLEALLKVPRAAEATFLALMARAATGDHRDHVADELGQLVLGTSGTFASREYPEAVIALVNGRVRLSEEDLDGGYVMSFFEVAHTFGVRDRVTSDFFPASALQGPFRALFRFHPGEALEFATDLLNHSAKWYGERLYRSSPIEPAWETEVVPHGQGPIRQWMNPRLYALYRGLSVGPYVLQSVLMALEEWLLSYAAVEGCDLDGWLLWILRRSNNVMATGVVASVCIAHPEASKRAGVALLSCRDLVQCDRSRLASERGGMRMRFSGMNPSHRLYESEREEADKLEHRRQDLETMATKLQFTDAREQVWEVIDRHRADVAEDDDSEETRVWRLALHRMDVRGFELMDPPAGPDVESVEAELRIYLGPGRLEPDVREMVDLSALAQAETGRRLALHNSAYAIWENRNCEQAGNWGELLDEARRIEAEIGEGEDFNRSGPGLMAAVAVRDHVQELSGEELSWCRERIELEIERDFATEDYSTRVARGFLQPDRACASVLTFLLPSSGSVERLLLRTLTHAVDEVGKYASEGLGAYASNDTRSLALRVAAGHLFKARLLRQEMFAQRHLPYSEQLHGEELIASIVPEFRESLLGGSLSFDHELELSTLEDWPGQFVADALTELLSHQPGWSEAEQWFTRLGEWLVGEWDRERSREDRRRNFELEHASSRAIAQFALRLATPAALAVCSPLLGAVDRHPRDTATFLQNLVFGADGREDDCFWHLWQSFADSACEASWVGRLDRRHASGGQFIQWIFLSVGWKEDVRHWQRLDGNAHRLETLLARLPAVERCLSSYARYLYSIGQKALPEAFVNLAETLERGKASDLLADSNTQFLLETILQRNVYARPAELKADEAIRSSVVKILSALVDAGSSASFRMRDDFVTPAAGGQC